MDTAVVYEQYKYEYNQAAFSKVKRLRPFAKTVFAS